MTIRYRDRILPLLASVLLSLPLFLGGCAVTSTVKEEPPSPAPTSTPAPEPTPKPSMRVVSDDDLPESPVDLYREAVTAMRRCEFERAAALFEQLGDFSDSELNRAYCLKRLDAEPIPEHQRYTSERYQIEDFDGGKLYALPQGYLYVPHTCDENTRSCIYFAGGAGEDYLYRRGVYYYLMHYQPNAVMLFHYESCVTHWESGTAKAAEIMEQVAQECGIVLHDMITVGSSAGSFTALHAAVILARDFGIPVRAALLLDASMEWDMPERTLLSDEECAFLAEHGTLLCLFEQEDALEYPEIHRMAQLGDRVLVIVCKHDDHNTISVYAYDFGLFSWGFEEIDLNEGEYTAYPIDK